MNKNPINPNLLFKNTLKRRQHTFQLQKGTLVPRLRRGELF
jgi:hypothetical protein